MDEAEPTEVAAREQPPKKSKVGTGIAAVLLLGIAAAAGVFGRGLLSHPPAKHAADGQEGAAGEEAKEGDSPGKGGDAPPEETVPMSQVIIDVRDKQGDVHHLKVGLQFETKPLPEEEFAKCLPRGREALVTYLRGLSFEEATDPKSFDKIKKDIEERTKGALGKGRVRRVLVTDFVAQ